MTTATMNSIPTEAQVAIQILNRCQQGCLATMKHFLQARDRHPDMGTVTMMRDCAEMCLMCSNLILDGSEFTGRTAQLCAEMCEKCLLFFESYQDDDLIQECADACRRCRDLCQSIGTQSYSYFRRSSLISGERLMEEVMLQLHMLTA